MNKLDSSACNGFHKGPLVFSEGPGFIMVFGDRLALWVMSDFTPVRLIGFLTGKTKQRDRNVIRPGCPETGKTKRRRWRTGIRQIVSLMRAPIFLNQAH